MNFERGRKWAKIKKKRFRFDFKLNEKNIETKEAHDELKISNLNGAQKESNEKFVLETAPNAIRIDNEHWLSMRQFQMEWHARAAAAACNWTHKKKSTENDFQMW